MPDDDSDYYGEMDGGGDAPDKPMDKGKDDETMEGETSMLPKSMFGGAEPNVGEEYIFKVEHIFENEVEVSYAKGGEEKDEEKPKGKSSMDDAVSGFDDIAKGNPAPKY